jgi:hypothetical protein
VNRTKESVGEFTPRASKYGSYGRAFLLLSTEIMMEFVLPHPRQIGSFSYDATRHVLLAHHVDGDVTVCSDVPESMYKALTRTLAPEELFVRYVRAQFDCETIPATRLQ